MTRTRLGPWSLPMQQRWASWRRRRAAIITALDKIEAGSILGPDNFGDELLWLIAECRRRWEKTREPDSAPGNIPPLHPGIERVMSAASAELHRRRLAGSR